MGREGYLETSFIRGYKTCGNARTFLWHFNTQEKFQLTINSVIEYMKVTMAIVMLDRIRKQYR